eukprot:TRINITY_DN15344_c0_g1_i1.p1 TRINITY_DN15344_c0_g1~~TRINITY_DN15344_c0_g1_i1.p1  ORF type:complete len:779 (+),score=153.58 TRINITY_DN15344_c0_g1_i1:58-2394(+)
MISKHLLVLASMMVGGMANGECMESGDCEAQVAGAVTQIRERITDRLQQEVEANLEVAPATVALSAKAMTDGLLNMDMTQARYETALLEHLWNQLENFPELDWIYYGDTATNNFLGFRRAYQCELDGVACTYGDNTTPENPPPKLAAGTLVRLITTGTTLRAYSTDPTGASGSDAKVLLYTQTSFDIRTRDWYTFGLANGQGWTDHYAFSGGNTGISYVQQVTVGGTAVGVLAADYELGFLNTFMREIPVAGDSTLMFVTSSGSLLANNKDVGTQVIQAADSTNPIIAGSSVKIFTDFPLFGDANADWTSITTKQQVGTVVINSISYTYDAVGIQYDKLRWLVAIISTESDFYTIQPNAERNCVLKTSCLSVLGSASRDVRERTLNHFHMEVSKYLTTAVSAAVLMDQYYNNGALHDVWCDTCGTIDIKNTAQRSLLKKSIKGIMMTYTELTWLYIGFEGGQFIGYKRVFTNGVEKLQLWTCYPPNDYDVCSGAAFYDSDVEPLVAPTVTTDILEGDVPKARPWYTDAISFSLGISESMWTLPYAFGSSEVGISLVKRALGGDWSTTTATMGVWGADYSLNFLSEFMSKFGVADTIILFVMDKEGTLLASNKGLPVNVKVGESGNKYVASAGKVLLDNTNIWNSQFMKSFDLPLDDEVERYWADFLRLTDPSSELRRSYDWTVVMITPESEIYDIDFIDTEAGDSDDGLEVWAIVVIVISSVLCLVFVVIIVIVIKKKQSDDKSKEPSEATRDTHMEGALELPVVTEEEGEAGRSAEV